ncbi:MAG: 3-deoxy-8-phosphooctulonate synthase, partial [Chthoniobacterales bacterium]|nr:3-deoxy-8-phosphooctulonate synthase [Chthoniobacterales bacterium]
MKPVRVGRLQLGGNRAPLFVIAGPCVIESERLVMQTAEALASVCAELQLPFVFKSSFDKANRTAGDSFRGPGLKRGLAILAKVKKEFGVP